MSDVIKGRGRLIAADVREVAQAAINKRLGCQYPQAILCCEAWRAEDTVLLHVNSGGNALEAEVGLRAAGYAVHQQHHDGYGVVLLVYRDPNLPRATE